MNDQIVRIDLEKYLTRVHEAGVFGEDSLLNRLLIYLIETELAGDGSKLKAYTIGLDVFGKPSSFDPSTDSSVRVAVGRLRTALALYESGDFADTETIVEIPVGTYRPQFLKRENSARSKMLHHMPATPSEAEGPVHGKSIIGRTTIFVIAFAVVLAGFSYFFLPRSDQVVVDSVETLKIETFRGDPLLAGLFTTALRRTSSQNNSIQVTSDSSPSSVSPEVDLILSGFVHMLDQTHLKVSVELSSVSTGHIVWAESRQFEFDDQLQQRIEQDLGSEIRIRIFGASKEELATRNPEDLSPEQLFLMSTWISGPTLNALEWEEEQIRLIQLALKKDQNYGAAHSVMADKLSYLANIYEAYNTPEMQLMTLAHIQAAKELAPLNPDVMFNVGQALWHAGELSDSAAVMKRVVELDSSHGTARFLSKMIPYTCSAASQETIEWALDFDSRLPTNSPSRWLTLSWIANAYFMRGELELALGSDERAELIFDMPYAFMRRATMLSNLGYLDEAKSVIRNQQDNWPDFSPTHFAEIAVPRLCSEEEIQPDYTHEIYELVDSMLAENQQ